MLGSRPLLTAVFVLSWIVACRPDDPALPPGGNVDARASADRRDARGPDDLADARVVDEEELVWRSANLTNFTSYPAPGSEECEDFSGCQWAGRFAFVDGQQTEAWVMAHNIAAVHSNDADAYNLRTLRLRDGANRIDVTVYDMCSDSDCGGCCTRNSRETGFLIDIEHYTAERFGLGDGIVEWACLDCE